MAQRDRVRASPNRRPGDLAHRFAPVKPPVQVVIKEAAGCGTALILGVDRASEVHRVGAQQLMAGVSAGDMLS